MRLPLVLFLSLAVCRAFADVPLAEEYRFLLRANYATDSTAAQPLRGGQPAFPIDPKSNTRLLRFDFPARERGEGIAIPLEGETKGRLLKSSLMIRGRGTLEPVLRSAEGSVALPAALHLREEWAWVEMTLRTGNAPGQVVLELPAPRARKGDYMEVQRVTLHAATEQAPDAVEVAPRSFPTRDYLREDGLDPSALTSETELRGLPFPRTAKPVTLALFCNTAASGGKITLLTREGTTGQVLAQASIPQEAGWVTLSGLSAQTAGAEVVVQITPAPGAPLEVGELVFSTSGNAAPLPALPADPAVRVGKIATFPAPLAEQWNDALWATALPLRDWGAAATTVRAIASPGALHLRFDGEEPLLRVVEQKTHEFRANEDAYTAFLRLPGGGEARVRIHADGRLTAERRTPGGTFAPWAGPTGAARQGDGHWAAILTLPLGPLGLADGELAARFSRHSAARAETHLWPGGNTPWGLLLRGEATAPLDITPPAQWRVGANPLAATTPGLLPAGEWLFHLRVEDEGGQRLSQTQVENRESLLANGGVSLVLPPAWGGRMARVQLAILDASLSPLRVFPAMTQRIEMPTATLTPGSGPYKVWLNGKEFAAATGTKETRLTLPLQSGANEVRLQSSSPGEARLEGDGYPPVHWQKVGSELRARLLREATRLWPTPQPAWVAAEGSAQHLAAVMEGIHHGARGWSLCFALPPELEFVAATSFYADRHASQPRFRWEEAGEVSLGGKAHRLIRVVADKPIPRQGEVSLHERAAAVWAFIRPRPGSAGETQLHYWSEAEEASVVEARRTVPVRILPPLAGKQPKRLHWQMWGPLEQMESAQARAAVLETARQAGITSFDIGSAGSASGWLTDEGGASGIRAMLRVHFLGGSLSMGPHLRAHPAQRLIRPDGKPNDSLACTSALLEEAWPAVEQFLAEQVRRYRPSCVVYDYEYSPIGKEAVHSCYCARCLAAFRIHAGLAGELTPEAIVRDHAAAWTDFMALQCARLFRKMKEGVHAAAPGTLFEVYSGYQSPENPKLYGVDWRYVGKLQAADRATMGYGRPLAAITATHEALAGIPALFGEILHPFLVRDTTPPQPTTAAAQLRRLLDSRHGVLLYELAGMDGRSWRAVAETTRLASAHEALFAEAERREIPGVEEANGALLTGKDGTLYCLMNPGPGELRLSFTLPGRGTEFYTGERFEGSTTLTLPPGESRAIHLPIK